ncbi:MAG TPA: DUF6544 family protein [Thermoanaerobaculia bacterium]|nr:DUF6544 family protein [Thermoanaerobaculia bacterium]
MNKRLAALGGLATLAAGVSGALAYGASRWQGETRKLRARMDAARLPAKTGRYGEREVESLPAPVRRYFRAVLRDGQPMITAARFSQEGQFRLSETEEKWGPFQATHAVTVKPPAFDWDARIAWAPGVKVYVRDAYAAGSGTLRAAAFGLVPLAGQHGTPELAEGELMRYLAEAAWYPTALLPGSGVEWAAIDDSTARASLADGATRVALDFHFDAEGLIASVRSPGRHKDARTVLPWQGRFRGYELRSGVRIPLEAEVEWVTPTGPQPYWRGRVTGIAYETAG